MSVFSDTFLSESLTKVNQNTQLDVFFLCFCLKEATDDLLLFYLFNLNDSGHYRESQCFVLFSVY